MNSAESLTSSPVSLFWLTVVLVIIGVVAGVISLIAWRSGIVKRRLLLSIVSRSRLLSAPEPMREDLKVSYEKLPLADPYVIVLELANVGKSHIKSEEFDQGRSLAFNINAPIVKVLSVEHQPKSAPPPAIVEDDDKLELRPELITKGEVIKAALLIDGPVGDIETAFDPFGDVDIQIRDRETWLAQRSRRRILAATAGATAATAFIVLAAIFTTIEANKSLALGKKAAVASSCSSLIQTTQGTGLALLVAAGEIEVSKDKAGILNSISFGPNYRQAVNDVKIQSKDMSQSYSAVKDSGVPLGAASAVPGKVTDATAILGRLSKEGTTSKAYDDFKTVLSVGTLVSSSHAIPPGCS